MKSNPSEASIRKLVLSHWSQHPIACWNKIEFHPWSEHDVITATSSGQVYEFEIKTSRADFLRDKEKQKIKAYAGDPKARHPHGRKPNRFCPCSDESCRRHRHSAFGPCTDLLQVAASEARLAVFRKKNSP